MHSLARGRCGCDFKYVNFKQPAILFDISTYVSTPYRHNYCQFVFPRKKTRDLCAYWYTPQSGSLWQAMISFPDNRGRKQMHTHAHTHTVHEMYRIRGIYIWNMVLQKKLCANKKPIWEVKADEKYEPVNIAFAYITVIYTYTHVVIDRTDIDKSGLYWNIYTEAYVCHR